MAISGARGYPMLREDNAGQGLLTVLIEYCCSHLILSFTPLLASLRTWLDGVLPTVPGKTKLGEALAYLHKYWPKLVRYVERGDLPIDNNRCENAIRPFVVGRKGCLFSDTPAGAHASAVIYSLVQTAKANGAEPYEWLCQVLRDLPTATTVEQVEALLPWHFGTATVDLQEHA